jgi:hypothetical protein
MHCMLFSVCSHWHAHSCRAIKFTRDMSCSTLPTTQSIRGLCKKWNTNWNHGSAHQLGKHLLFNHVLQSRAACLSWWKRRQKGAREIVDNVLRHHQSFQVRSYFSCCTSCMWRTDIDINRASYTIVLLTPIRHYSSRSDHNCFHDITKRCYPD